MNKKVMSSSEKQVNLIMVGKILINFFFLISISFNSFSEILYEKDNIIITDIDIKIYQKHYKNNYGLNINNTNALKDLVLMENVINNLKKNNSEFMDKLDQQILIQYESENLGNENILNFIRFSKIRNEFIVNYFQNELNSEEIKNLFSNLDSLNLPISKDKCLIIKEILDLKNNFEFIDSYIDYLKNKSDKIMITINGNKYHVCIDSIIFKELENLIIEYIQMQINEEFQSFVYERAKN